MGLLQHYRHLADIEGLQRIRAARYEVFLTIDDFENVNGDDFDEALNEMDKISRYETRALSKTKRSHSSFLLKMVGIDRLEI